MDTPNNYMDRVVTSDVLPSLLASDAAADLSNKVFTVPAGKTWEVMTALAQLVTTATVGNRYMVFQWDDGTNILGSIAGTQVQAASLTRRYTWAPGVVDQASFRDIGGAVFTMMTPIPRLVLPAGYRIRILDTFAIDAAADDMTVRILGWER